MAAGSGSRYGTLKQFDKLGPNNEFLFEFSLFDAIDNGFDHVVLITKEHLVNEISDYLKKRLPKRIKIDVLAQKVEDTPKNFVNKISREKPWGTAHAVWSARNHINNSFVVVNADDYYGKEAYKIAANLISNKESTIDFGLIAYSLIDTLSDYGSVSRGICQTKDTELEKIVEFTKIEKLKNHIIDHLTKTKFTGREFVSMNFWICEPSIFNEIEAQFYQFLSNERNIKNEEFYLPDILQKMINEKGITVGLYKTTVRWFGITYIEDKEIAKNKLNDLSTKKEYPSPLWKN